jgi:hypothetical protein
MLLTKKKCAIAIPARTTLGELLRRFWIQMSYLGASGLWAGTITAALTGSMPDGVTAWLTAGVGMLLYQEWQLRTAVKNAETGVDYWRRVAMLWNVRAHIGCNTFVITVLWARIFFTSAELSKLDQISLLICVGCMGATGLSVKAFRISTPVALFLYAVSSRVIEQVTVVFSPSIGSLPPATVNGLLIVAVVIVINMGLELNNAQQAYRATGSPKAKQTRRALGWAFSSAALNGASAGLVNMSWQLAR